MANLKDLIVNGTARVIGKVYASEFVGNASSATRDSSNNIITETYATKTELTTALGDVETLLSNI